MRVGLFILLCVFQLVLLGFTRADPVIDTILTGYISGQIPSGVQFPMTIDHQISLTPFSMVEELQMNMEIIYQEKLIWSFPSLAYQSNPSVPDKYKDSHVSLNSVIDRIWQPSIHITAMIKKEVKDQSLILYPNGTLEYTSYNFVVLH